MPNAAEIRSADRAIWLIIGVLLVIDLGFVASGRFDVDWRSYVVASGAIVAALAIVRFYRTLRPDPMVAATVESTAQLVAFPLVGAPLSYIAASAALPWQDNLFAALDQAMGFDWRAALYWTNAYPLAHKILALAYSSFIAQALVAVIVLGPLGKTLRLKTFLLSFMVAAVVTIIISALLPALGAWPHYGIKLTESPDIVPVVRDTYVHTVMGIRDGTVRLFVGDGAEGIITFPSFHAALALILMLTFWSVPYLRWPALVLNALMIVSTPIEGSHYLVDVFAGLVIGALCWLGVRRYLAATVSRSPATLQAPAFARNA